MFVLFFSFSLCAEEVLYSFEGVYSSDFGAGLYVCQDANFIRGSWDELGILVGTVDGNVATGSYWIAGTGPCVRGQFTWTLTSEGFEGSRTCQFTDDVYPWKADQFSLFRPTNSECALLYNADGGLDIEGEWTDREQLALDVCFIDPLKDQFGTDAQVSFQKRNTEGAIVNWYAEGLWGNDGKIFQGTYYYDLNAGAILIFLRDNGNIDYFWWTGIIRTRGQTYIDELQLHDPSLHGRGTFNGPRTAITATDCAQFEVLKTFVFTNLPEDDDNDYYYFVDTSYLDSTDFRYFYIENDANQQVIAILFITLAIVFTVFV